MLTYSGTGKISIANAKIVSQADGKIVVFFKDAGKFSYRYSTLGFEEAANLDDGDLWPVSYALKKWSPMVEKQVVELVNTAMTVIDNNARQMGELAARLLLNRLERTGGGDGEFSEFRVGGRLVERDSCRAPGGR